MGPKHWSWDELYSAQPYYQEPKTGFKMGFKRVNYKLKNLNTWYKVGVCLLLFLVVWGAQRVEYPGSEGVRRFTVYVFTTHKDLTPYLKMVGEKLILGDPVQPAVSPGGGGTAAPKPLTTMQLIYPVSAGRVISYSQPQNQYAVCIQTKPGQLVRATQAGRIAVVTGDKSAGYTVQIDHGNGFVSILESLAEVWVKPDDQVQSAQTVGKMTALGNNALLSFKLTFQGQPHDPLNYINGKQQ